MRKFVTFFVVLVWAFGALAQTEFTQHIRGTVVDATTGMPLPGATVVLLDYEPQQGTTTDDFGNFVLENVRIGRRSLELSFVGYQKSVLGNLLLETGRETRVNVALQEDAVQIGEVAVTASKPKDRAQNEMAVVSARTFSVEETERFAGSLGDPARMVANYAGVMSGNDSRNDIVIRGNSPAGVLWRLEGIEVANPNHFGAMGTTGGPVSMINNNLLANSDFMTGAFPAEYGNALAGAFDLQLRSGNRDKYEFVGQVGFNGFELGAEGPIATLKNGQKASFLANYRYSTLELIDKLGFDLGTGTAIPRYKDFTFMVDVPSTKMGRFKLFGIFGNSDINLGRDYLNEEGSSYTTRGTAVDYGASLAIVGLTHTLFVGDKLRIKSSVSYQKATTQTVFDSIKMPQAVVEPNFRGSDEETRLSFSTQFTYKANARNNFVMGATVSVLGASYLDSAYIYEESRFRNTMDLNGSMLLSRGYFQWQHHFSNSLSSYVGVHSQYLKENNSSAVEPRLSVKWQATERMGFSLGYGLHSQIQTIKTYNYLHLNTLTNVYEATNHDLGFSKSQHFVLGYDLKLNGVARLKIETYYQALFDVPVSTSFKEYSLANTGDNFGGEEQPDLVNKGLGKNYGVEFTLERFLSKGYYFLLTTSVFESKYTGIDDKWRNTAFNGNFVANLLGGYEFSLGKNKMLTLDIKTVWAGGRRFVPIDLVASKQQHNQVLDWGKAYENKFDDYFRTDLRIGFKINSRKFSQEWGLDLQNLTGFQSVFVEAYDVEKSEVYQTYQQGFLPMMLYRIRF